MKVTFTKLFATDGPNVNGARIVIDNGLQVRAIDGKIGGPFEDGYYVATLRGPCPVNITIEQVNTTIEVRVTED